MSSSHLHAPRKPRRSSIEEVRRVPAVAMTTNMGGTPVPASVSRNTTRSSTMSQSDSPYELFFVKSDGKSDKEKFHREMFRSCQKIGLDPLWMNAADVLKVEEHDINFFVFHHFEGPEFEHVKKLKCKVVSSFLIRECLRQETSLMKVDVPLYSLHLRGVIVCFTGFGIEERDQLTSLVFAMGGKVQGPLSESMTHLVAAQYDPDSKKYKMAANLRRPIMNRSWIDESWQLANAHSPDNCLAEEFVNGHKLALFKGTIITKTGIAHTDLPNLTRLIEKNGGKYTAELNRRCTHMITETTSGQKYFKAKEWGTVKIVDVKWLIKSVENGYVLPESRYDPDRHHCSTPKQDGIGMEDLELSAIAGPAHAHLGTQNDMTMNLESDRTPRNGPSTRSRVSRSIVSNSTISHSDKSAAGIGMPASSQMDKSRLSMLRGESSQAGGSGAKGSRSSSLRREPSRGRLSEHPQVLLTRRLRDLSDPIEKVDEIMLRGDYDYLEGFRVIVVGAAPNDVDRWKRLLNCLGATRVSQITKDTVIAVVRVKGAEDEAILRTGRDVGATVVSAQWAVQCVLDGEEVPVEEYLWEATIVKLQAELETPREGDVSRGLSGKDINSSLESRPVEHADSLPADEGQEQDELPTDSPCYNVFRGATFRLYPGMWTSKEEEELSEELEKHGGRPICTLSVPSLYLLCPMVEFAEVPSLENANVEQIVSIYWMRDCIALRNLQPVNTHPLYRPLPACEGSQVFQDCTVAFTGLEAELRRVLSVLVVQFGGMVDNQINRYDAETGKRRTTHVIAGQTSARTTTSMEWGIPVVDCSWIIECVINDKLIRVEQFSFKGTLFAGYTGRTDDAWEMAERGRDGGGKGTTNTAETTVDQGAAEVAEIPTTPVLNSVNPVRQPETGMKNTAMSSLPSPFVSNPAIAQKTTSDSHLMLRCTPRNQRHETLMSTAGGGGSTDSFSGNETPSKFLNPDQVYHPRFHLKGLTQAIDGLSSPTGQSTFDSLSTTAVGRIMEVAVENTGKVPTTVPGYVAMADCQESPVAHGQRGLSTAGRIAGTIIQDTVVKEADKPVTVLNTRSRKGAAAVLMEEAVKDDEESVELRLLRGQREKQQRELKAAVEERIQQIDSQITENSQPRERRKRTRLRDGGSPVAKRSSQATTSSTITLSDGPDLPMVDWEMDIRNSQGHHIAADPFGDTSTMHHQTPAGSRAVSTRSAQRASSVRVPVVTSDVSRTTTSAVRPVVTVTPVAHSTMSRRAIDIEERSRVEKMQTEERQRREERLRAENEERVRREEKEKETRAREREAMEKIENQERQRREERHARAERERSRGLLADVVKEEEARAQTASVTELTGKVFYFSSIPDVERQAHLRTMVESLGGSVVECGEALSDKVTHLICGRVVRNEKILSGIARGLWLLVEAFVTDSKKTGQWMKESDYEWVVRPELQTIKEREQQCLRSALWWREHIAVGESRTGQRNGAFMGWRAMVYCTKPARAEQLHRVIQSGSGQSVNRNDIPQPLEYKPTHVLVDSSPLWTAQELQMLSSHGIPVFKLDYLVTFLVRKGEENAEDYHEDYKKWKEREQLRKK